MLMWENVLMVSHPRILLSAVAYGVATKYALGIDQHHTTWNIKLIQQYLQKVAKLEKKINGLEISCLLPSHCAFHGQTTAMLSTHLIHLCFPFKVTEKKLVVSFPMLDNNGNSIGIDFCKARSTVFTQVVTGICLISSLKSSATKTRHIPSPVP